MGYQSLGKFYYKDQPELTKYYDDSAIDPKEIYENEKPFSEYFVKDIREKKEWVQILH